MTHPTADYLSRILRREHERHVSPQFKLVGDLVPELGFTEDVKVFGDMVEFHHYGGKDYFIPIHMIKLIAHDEPTEGAKDGCGWTLYI